MCSGLSSPCSDSTAACMSLFFSPTVFPSSNSAVLFFMGVTIPRKYALRLPARCFPLSCLTVSSLAKELSFIPYSSSISAVISQSVYFTPAL